MGQRISEASLAHRDEEHFLGLSTCFGRIFLLVLPGYPVSPEKGVKFQVPWRKRALFLDDYCLQNIQHIPIPVA